MIKNIKSLLTEATSYPAAIEAKLPAGVPKLSTMLLDVAGKIPAVPDFPVALPDLPAPPVLPELPGAPAELRRYVTGVQVTPPVGAAVVAPAPAPVAPVKPGLIPFVYE